MYQAQAVRKIQCTRSHQRAELAQAVSAHHIGFELVAQTDGTDDTV